MKSNIHVSMYIRQKKQASRKTRMKIPTIRKNGKKKKQINFHSNSNYKYEMTHKKYQKKHA
jgi:hypothetical protein